MPQMMDFVVFFYTFVTHKTSLKERGVIYPT